MIPRFKRIAACLLIVSVVWKTYSLIIRDWYLVMRIPGSGKEITAIAFSPDGSTLAFSSRGAPKVHVWDLISKKRKFILDRRNVTNRLRFTESGNLVGTGPSNSDYARLWNSSGQVVKSYQTEDEFEAEMPDFAIRFNVRRNPLNNKVGIIEGNLHRGVRLLDPKTRSQIGFFPYRSRSIDPVAKFSRDGKHLVVAGGEIEPYDLLPLLGPKRHYGEVKIWEIATSRVLSQYTSDRAVTAIEFSPDERYLAVGFEDGSVEILDESFTLTQAGK